MLHWNSDIHFNISSTSKLYTYFDLESTRHHIFYLLFTWLFKHELLYKIVYSFISNHHFIHRYHLPKFPLNPKSISNVIDELMHLLHLVIS